MDCEVCTDYTNLLDIINESYDNYHRWYYRTLVQVDKVEKEQTYRYSQLKHEKQTRLVTVLPGHGEEAIRCEIEQAEIGNRKGKGKGYIALSYVWGSGLKQKSIFLGGTNFFVTDNLFAALWHIRSYDESLRVWIDAICIDQTNLSERAVQVRHMKQIYENASEVLIWLGPEAYGSRFAMDKLAQVYDEFDRRVDRFGGFDQAFQNMLYDRSWIYGRFASRNGGPNNPGAGMEFDGVASDIEFIADDPRTWASMWKFMKLRTWFQRVWIIQEGTVPSPVTVQVCHRKIPLDAIFLLTRLSSQLPGSCTPKKVLEITEAKVLKLYNMSHRRKTGLRKTTYDDSGNRTQINLLDVLEEHRGHRATDPRDKVYSALGLATDERTKPIEIDYERPLHLVLYDVAISCLYQQPHNLRFLGHAGIWGSDQMPASWVPDWYIETPYRPFPKSATWADNTGIDSLFDPMDRRNPLWQDTYHQLGWSTKGMSLTVHGVRIDTITGVTNRTGQPGIIDTIEYEWAPDNLQEVYWPTNESIETAYLTLLVADLKYRGGNVVGRGNKMRWRTGVDNRALEDLDLLRAVHNATYGRRFATTEQGYFCLVPFSARPGDQLYTFMGGEMIYLVRPSQTIDVRSLTMLPTQAASGFVGEAYVHGLMDGVVAQRFWSGEYEMKAITLGPTSDVPISARNDACMDGIMIETEEVDENIFTHKIAHPYDLLPYLHERAADPFYSMHHIEVIVEDLKEQMGPGIDWSKEPLEQRMREGMKLWKDYGPVKPVNKSNLRLLGSLLQDSRATYTGRFREDDPDFVRILPSNYTLTSLPGAPDAAVPDIYTQMGTTDRSPGEISVSDEDEQLARMLQATEWSDENCTELSDQPSSLQNDSRRPQTTHPGLRLIYSPGRGPSRITYDFSRSAGSQKEFSEDIRREMNPQTGQPPVLFGKYASDTNYRPRVDVYAFSQLGDLTWEDSSGSVLRHIIDASSRGISYNGGKGGLGWGAEEWVGDAMYASSQAIAKEMIKVKQRLALMKIGIPDPGQRTTKGLIPEDGWDWKTEIQENEKGEKTLVLKQTLKDNWEGDGEAEVPQPFELLENTFTKKK
ncbi:hypothetical protein M501DRAFT_999224 [Patellaria atrata CBS 101060]|uniref:Heterokaryon incompatibility domain-containing protein n=1 Tax=Patellaria atrata CBS 101060 TaxID=1346257 RepID=A0A9P4S4K4_9PEZI|nr:hypothetical protein M501DRAFT_999224 [Patellaria atrata CBS 101060]